MDRAVSCLYKYVVTVLFFLITAFLTVLSFFNTSVITQDYTEMTLFVKDQPLRGLILLFLFVLALFLLSRIKIVKSIITKINEDKKVFNIIVMILLAIVFCAGLSWILTADLEPHADQYSIQLAAAQMRRGNYEFAYENAYVARNPQQSGLILVSYILTFIFGIKNYIALEVINVLLICLIYFRLSQIGEHLGLNYFERLMIIASALVFPVPLFYSYFIYGLIPGLAFILSSIWHEINYFKHFKIKDLIFCGLYASLALLCRTNNMVVWIAMFIYAISKIVESKKTKTLVIVPVLLISLLFQSFIPVNIMESMSGQKLDNGMSYYSYIAMGLQDGERAPGWYNGYNNDSYEASGFDHVRQKQIAIEEINRRLDRFSKDGDQGFEFFMKKIASQWNNPTFQVFWNLEGKIHNDKTRSSWAMFFIQKKGAYDFQKYLNIIQSFILSGTIIWLLMAKIKEEDSDVYLLPLAFIGGFLFHIIWEAKAQYTFVYFILLIPYAIKGFKELLTGLTRDGLKKQDVSLIVKTVVIIMMILLFCFGKTSFLDTDNMRCYCYINDLEYEEE